MLMIKVDCVITSYELLPKFHTMLRKCSKVKTLIVMEDQIHQVDMTGTDQMPLFIYVSMFLDTNKNLNKDDNIR